MTAKAAPKPGPAILGFDELSKLFEELRRHGNNVYGPAVRDETIVYTEIHSVNDLPSGWTDDQNPGRYRLKRRDDGARFGYQCAAQSWKRFLHEPAAVLWEGKREGLQTAKTVVEPQKMAFIGVRPCELAAIRIQDKVLMEGPYADARYCARRKQVLMIAVNCGQAGGTCFCHSTDTGPRAQANYDLCLTEILEGTPRYLMETGSERGRELLSALPVKKADANDLKAAERTTQNAVQTMGRTLETRGLRETLYEAVEHPQWDAVAKRCLGCANCTLVCPTCFCSTMEDTTDLTGTTAKRERKWDSCFNLDFSYIHGGSVRVSAKARYRHWLTHKLGTWIDQFGSLGCVGCGRCITWCPVGIDITEEAAAIRHFVPTKEVWDGND